MGDGEKKAASRAENEIKGELLLKQLAQGTGGQILIGSEALTALNFIRKRTVSMVHKYKGPMNIGALEIQVATYGKTSVQNMPTLKKESAVAVEQNGLDTGVRMVRTYYNKLGEDDVEVEKLHRIKAYPYGKQLVPFSEADIDNLKYTCDKCLTVLAFVPIDTVKRYWCLGAVDCVVPMKDAGVRNGLKFSAFVHALKKEKLAVTARYVKRKNATPVFALLTPEINPENECLYLNQLPFSEDYRDYVFGSFEEKHKPDQNQRLAMRNLIKRMDLNTMEDEDGFEFEALNMEEVFNPCLRRFYQNVEKRAFDPEVSIEELDPAVAKTLNPDEKLLISAKKEVKNVVERFPLQVVEKKTASKNKKRHWRDFLSGDGSVAHVSAMLVQEDEDLIQAKKLKGASLGGEGIDTKIKMDDIVAHKVDMVGSATPVEDLKAMAERKDDPDIITRAIKEMWKIINDCVQESFGSAGYPKAVDCIQALREVCVKNEESSDFNTGLEAIAKSFRDRKAFWDMVVDAKMRPIDKTEDATSKYTKEASKKFLTPDETPMSAPSLSGPAEEEEEDMFDSME
mmetsp:Transcript_521/g.689  ORF Transcript_521/g.689 Transcript_521/m.689 type:complete len:568 (-) Transcript_521:137-1840(-)